MSMTISFTSQVRLYCKVCGDALEVEESQVAHGKHSEFLVTPCKRCLPKVADVHDVLAKLHGTLFNDSGLGR